MIKRALRWLAKWSRVDSEHLLLQLREMETKIDEGGFYAEAEFGGPAANIFAAQCVQWFREHGGVNYVTVHVRDKKTGQDFNLTMQKVPGLTPAQKISELTEQRDRYHKQLIEAGILV